MDCRLVIAELRRQGAPSGVETSESLDFSHGKKIYSIVYGRICYWPRKEKSKSQVYKTNTQSNVADKMNLLRLLFFPMTTRDEPNTFKG